MYEIDELPMTEYMGWLAFFHERQREKEGQQGNLLAMESDDMVSALTGEQ